VKDLDENLGDQDTLYVLILDHHAYIILHFAKLQFCVIGDNENAYCRDESIKEEIGQIFGTRTKAMRVRNPYFQDICGGIGICIGLEMMRLYHSSKNHPGEWPAYLDFNRKLKQEVLETEYSDLQLSPLPDAVPNIYGRFRLACDIEGCAWKTISTDRRKLPCHLRNCHNKGQTNLE